MTRIFISYRRDDSAYVAAAINEKLEQRFGAHSVFFDIDSIPLGTDFRQYISDAVSGCDVLLAIIGDTWIEVVDKDGNRRLDNPVDFVRLELESALERDIPVIPVLVDEAPMPSKAALPSSLRDLAFRNAAEVRAGRDLQEHLARLVKGVEKSVEAREKQPASTSFQNSSIESPADLLKKSPKAAKRLADAVEPSTVLGETQIQPDKPRPDAQLAGKRLVPKAILQHPVIILPGTASALAGLYMGLFGLDPTTLAVAFCGVLVSVAAFLFMYFSRSKAIASRLARRELDSDLASIAAPAPNTSVQRTRAARR